MQEQRKQRALAQLQLRKDRDSFVPLVPNLAVPAPAVAPAAKTPLDQTFTLQQPQAPRKLRSKASGGISRLLNKSSHGKLSPGATAAQPISSPTPHDTRTPRSLVKSPEITSADLPSFGSQSLGLGLRNAGIEYECAGDSPRLSVPELTDAMSSPETAALSTPETPASSLFERSSSAQGSDYSRATSHDTTRNRTSTRSMKMSGLMSQESRPLDMATDVIREEPIEEKRQASGVGMGLPRSETAEWIRQQQREASMRPPRQRQDSGQSLSSRERQGTTTSYESAVSSIHPMVVDTSSSGIGNGKDGLSEGGGKGPWPQSPLLLNPTEKDTSASVGGSAGGVGLGLDLGGMGLGLQFAPQRQSVIVGRHEVESPAFRKFAPTAASPTLPPSPASSAEGFSMNTTQPRLPSAPASNSSTQQRRSMLGGRFFSSGSHAGKQQETQLKSPPLRALTLVEQEDVLRTTRRHSLAVAPGAGLAASMNAATVAPNTAPIPDSGPTFPATTAVPTAFERSKRSAKHVRRVSRLQYIPHENGGSDDVQVTISPPQPSAAAPKRFSVIGSGAAGSEADRLAMLASFKSPRPAPSPSGETPDMVYGDPRGRSRFSWGYVPRRATDAAELAPPPPASQTLLSSAGPASLSSPKDSEASASTPHSPWQDFDEDGRGLRETQEVYESLRDVRRAEPGDNGEEADSSILRRRGDGSSGDAAQPTRHHRHTSSAVAPTATIQPFAWKQRFSGNAVGAGNANKRSSVHLDIVAGDGDGVKLGSVVEDEPNSSGGAGAGLRRLRLQGDLRGDAAEGEEQQQTRPMSIFVPLAILQSHLRRRHIEEREQRLLAAGGRDAAMGSRAHVHAQAVSSSAAANKSMLAAGSHLLYSSGRLLDADVTSKTLFFAGFLGMPWLWLIGGWWLANDGLMLTPGAQQVQFYTHEASMEESRLADEQRVRSQHERSQQQQQERQRVRESAQQRLSTIYSVDGDELSGALSRETMPTLYEGDGTTTASRSATTTMAMATTLSSMPSLSSSSTRSPSPRTLLAHSSDKLPHAARRSVGSMLNPQPSVALFHSPVRSVPESMVNLNSDDSGVDISDGGDGEGGAEGDAHGEDDKRHHSYLKRRDERSSRVVFGGDYNYNSYTDAAPSSPAPLVMRRQATLYERLAATEKFVLMNRFMAVVSTIAVFASFGVALNAVAMNF